MRALIVLGILLASTASYARMCDYNCVESGMDMRTCRQICNP